MRISDGSSDVCSSDLQRNVPAVGPSEIPFVRLRPQLRGALPLLRSGSGRGTARGYRDGVEARYGGLDGADGDAAGRGARGGWISRARTLDRDRGWRGQYDRLTLWTGTHRNTELTTARGYPAWRV